MKTPEVALMVGAHPDDCEFGAGGSAWKWSQAGAEVHFVIVTDGSRGSGNSPRAAEELVKVRQQEQQAAADCLGVKSCRFLRFPDGGLEESLALRSELVRVIRELRPQVVCTHTPEPLHHRPFRSAPGSARINHRDHRITAQATLDAVYPTASNPNSFTEFELEPHRVKTVLLWGSRYADLCIDITEAGLEAKVQALSQHHSQFGEAADWDTYKGYWGTSERFEKVKV